MKKGHYYNIWRKYAALLSRGMPLACGQVMLSKVEHLEVSTLSSSKQIFDKAAQVNYSAKNKIIH